MNHPLKHGFTLIELLVVIAVIGILASVVLASLNSARVKGQEAAIKSNLSNMIAAAELSYDTNGNYSGVCTAVQPMMAAIEKVTKIQPVCFSYNSPELADVNLRWAVSATNVAKDKNWSVDGAGVVTWDTANNGSIQTWNTANAACATAGKKLPSLEQLKTLYDTHGATPSGFTANNYWSGTSIPSTFSGVYFVGLNNGTINGIDKSGAVYCRCVQ